MNVFKWFDKRIEPTIGARKMPAYIPILPPVNAVEITNIQLMATAADTPPTPVENTAAVGDYLVTEPDGSVTVVAKAVFEAEYKLAP